MAAEDVAGNLTRGNFYGGVSGVSVFVVFSPGRLSKSANKFNPQGTSGISDAQGYEGGYSAKAISDESGGV